ncbi:HU family DNA-binding protein [Dysgonomonas sp. 520]|uniref:HU family DNA-binding protein n=1 Tax=Dysgonomonas sp. 520 TaxID=2302931 RepID=UPI0013D36068|nr:HU family DNA-binding protein [Dysgonomonas sp. 520]NDW09583.1 hypothetical protein [Dysgonomonas sp. 520]
MVNEDIRDIVERLKSANLMLSELDIYSLLRSLTDSINQCLDDGAEVEIDDFGSFQRRKGKDASYTSFKPVVRLGERINRGK